MDVSGDSQSTDPNPKRFWWLKRLSLAALVLVVLLVGLRLIWGARVQARLDETIADIQAKSEPILFEDLIYEPLPDAENGAWYLMQALQNWPSVPGQPGVSLFDTDWYMEGEEAGFADPITDNAAYLASCQPVLDLLRQAGDVERSVWGSPPTRPLFYMLMPHLGETRMLARYVDDVAYRALAIGHTELALETVLLKHTIARHVLGENPNLIDGLVVSSILAMNREFIEKALPQIDLVELRSGRARELAKQLIASHTDGLLQEAFVRGFIGERAANYDIYESLIDGTETAANLIDPDAPIAWIIDTPGLSHAYRPAIKNEQDQTTRVITEIIAGLQAGVHPSKLQDIENEFVEHVYSNRLQYPVGVIYFSALGSAANTYYRSEATHRCAAVAIAIRLYQADHEGKRPERLEQLVPEYIAAIPVDPFSKTGEPIRYNPAGIVPIVIDAEWLTDEQFEQLKQQSIRPYPLLYSIGEDNQYQNGGPLYLAPYGDLDDWARFDTNEQPGDIWFLLDAWPEAIFEENDLGTDTNGRTYEQAF